MRRMTICSTHALISGLLVTGLLALTSDGARPRTPPGRGEAPGARSARPRRSIGKQMEGIKDLTSFPQKCGATSR